METSVPDKWTSTFWNGMYWVVAKGYDQRIPAQIWDKTERPESFAECRLLKKSVLRTSLLVHLDEDHNQPVFVKRHHRRSWKDDLRSLFMPSRAYNEWKVLLHFNHLHLPAPMPLGYGEKRSNGVLRESCVVTSAILSAQPLFPTLPHQLNALGPEKRLALANEIVMPLARLIARLHNKGVYFRDLHGGNILYRYDDSGHPEFFFVDTDKARFSWRIARRNRIDDLAQLYISLFRHRTFLWVRFLKRYCTATKEPTLHWRYLFPRVGSAARTLLERHIRSRSKRCLKNTTAFGVVRRGGTKVFFRKAVPLSLIDEAIEQAHQVMKRDSKPPAAGRESVVISSLRSPETSFRVTSYAFSLRNIILSIFGLTAAKEAWVNGNALLVRNIPTFQPIALYETTGRIGISSSSLVEEALGNRESAENYFIRNFLSDKGEKTFLLRCRFIEELAQSIRRLYQTQVFFSVLSSKDIFVEETAKGAWRFSFAFDRHIAFDRLVSVRKQRTNIVQLHSSLGPAIPLRDQLRFLRAFTRHMPRDERMAFTQQIIRQVSRMYPPPLSRADSL